MPQRYQTVLFDFGGTLDSDGVAWKERVHSHYLAEGLAMSAADFAPAFYAADDRLVGTIPRTADLAATLGVLTGNLEAGLAGPGTSPDKPRGERTAARFMAEAETCFTRNRPFLRELARRYRLGIVSNFYGNLEAICAGAGLAPFFGAIVDSHRVGAEKPDPAIFEAALRPLGAVPATTLFVGDSLRRDREGARRMGMDFVWIAPAEMQATETSAIDHPVIARLTDLVQLLA
jgi:putative hydrolase of the HAD superfamily